MPGFLTNEPWLAKISATIGALGLVVGFAAVLGYAPSTSLERGLILAGHAVTAGCFLAFWLMMMTRQRLAYSMSRAFSTRHLSFDARAPHWAPRIPWSRVGMSLASTAYFVFMVSRGDGTQTMDWSAESVASITAGWVMMGTIVAAWSGTLKRSIAAARAKLRPSSDDARP